MSRPVVPFLSIVLPSGTVLRYLVGHVHGDSSGAGLPASLSRKWKRLLRDPARAPDSSSCSEEASASKPSPGGLPVPVGCPVPSGLSSPVGCPVPPRSVCLQCGPHLPGGGSYVSPLSCVSCGPASCVLIWFVSCPR